MPDFVTALRQAYASQPCQVLPQPLWEVLPQLDALETAFTMGADGPQRLEAWTEDSLLIYWRTSGRRPSPLINRRLEYQQYAVIHQDFLDPPTVAGFRQFQSRFRLQHALQAVPAPQLPDGLQFAGVVDSPDEAQAIADHLGQGDNLAAVQSWLNSPALATDLWVWVIDTAADQPVGLGIAELDAAHQEAALVQVQAADETARQALVYELLRRIGTRATFATVSDEVEDRQNPGAFFRWCGFTGHDVWWSLSR
jgi:hypothetical protein